MEQPRFLHPETPLPGLEGRTVGDFWQWAYSDILSNRNRSIFAEFIVGSALGVVEVPRIEWDSIDLLYGDLRIEVKSSADYQSWDQKKPSTIRFGVRKAVGWNPSTAKYEGDPTRSADLYVFCHYPERENARAGVLGVPAWDFYVITTAALNRDFGSAKSLSLSSVRRFGVRCKFDGLRAAVDHAAETIEKISK